MSGENSNPPAGANPPFSGGGGQPPFSNDDPDRTRLGGVGGAGVPLPEQVGAYRIIRLLGIGGMGAVYEAEQAKPKRIVALKVLKPGMVSPAMLRRFEMEAEVLGRLQHPGIAQVYEAGTADSGGGAGGGAGGGGGPQPFFAMELIRGRPLIQYADAHQLDLPQRLALFVRVCEAVHYAHQQGVIHRDLKPSNILVEESGQPKVLDFGIAKATGSDVQAVTLQTDVGQIIGTLEYMSPEQAAGDTKQVDTRSDIYALGVIGYELLSGKLPLDLKGQMLHEAVRAIQQDEPGRLSSSNRRLKGDLETIVGKALEKEKQRRYQSASELAGDIKRYLNDEPIAARRPGTWYQASKFARRHKTLVGAAATVMLVLLLGIAGTTAEMVVARHAKEQAEANAKTARQAESLARERQKEAEQARQVEAEQRTRAEAEADRARRSDYANRIFLADDRLNEGNVAQARALLDGCPMDLRYWEWGHLYRMLDTSLTTLRGHENMVMSVTWSRDGKRIVSGGMDNTIKVWDAEKGGEALLTLRGHTGGVMSVAYSPDAKRIVSGSGSPDNTIKVWDAEKGGEALLTLRGHTDYVYFVAWSPDGKRIVSGSGDNTIKVWDAEKGREAVLTLRGNTGVVSSVAWSPDGKRIVSGGRDNTIKVWDAEKGGEATVTLRGHAGSVNSVAWSPDGRRVASGSGDDTIKIWDAEKGGEPLLTLRGQTENEPINSVAWSPDGKRIVSGSYNNTIRVWDAETGGEALLTLRGHAGPVSSVAYSPDGKRIVSGSWDSTIKIWEVDKGGEDPLILRGHTEAVNSVAWSADSKQIVSGGEDQMIVVWNTENGGEAPLTFGGHTGPVTSVAWSPDGKRFVSGSYDQTIKVWAAEKRRAAPGEIHSRYDRTTKAWVVENGREALLTLRGHTGPVSAVAWSPDGKRIASGSFDNTIKIWDADKGGEALLTLRGHTNGATSVAWSPDGKRIASGGYDNTVKVWDAEKGGEALLTLSGHRSAVRSVAWSPDSKKIASGGWFADHTVKVWDAEKGGDALLTLRGHTETEGVNSVAWSSDGTRIVSGGSDNSIKVWDAEKGGEALLTLRGHAGVESVAWSPNGRNLAAGSDDGTVRVWSTAPEQEHSQVSHLKWWAPAASLEGIKGLLAAEPVFTVGTGQQGLAHLHVGLAGDCLAISGTVVDSKITQAVRPWEESCIEVFGSTMARSTTLGHVCLTPATQNKSAVVQRMTGPGLDDRRPAPEIEFRTKMVAGGYTFTGMIPLRLLAIEPDSTAVLLEFQITTHGGPGDAIRRTTLFGSPHAYMNSKGYGHFRVDRP